MSRADAALEANRTGKWVHLWVPGPLPGLNQLLDERARSFRRGATLWNGYTDLKREWEDRIKTHALAQGFPALLEGEFAYTFIEPNKRRDPSNVASGALKLIEDALVKAGLLKNDGWSAIKKLELWFLTDESEPGAYLEVLNPVFWQKTEEDTQNEREKRENRARAFIERRKNAARAHGGRSARG